MDDRTLTIHEIGLTDDGKPCVVLVGSREAIKAAAKFFGEKVVIKLDVVETP
jgi:hypothetical protein